MKQEQLKYDITGNYDLVGTYIEVTSECNLRCLHCYNESGELKNIIGLKAFKQTIDVLPEDGSASVTLSGGEPMLHPHIWEFIEIIQNKNFGRNLMITNATMIDEEVAKRLFNSGISLQISLNGSCPETHDMLCGKGTFERTLSGINNLIKAGCADRILIRCMISNYNMNDIENTTKMLVEIGIRNINFAVLALMGRAKKKDAMYLNAEEKGQVIEKLNNSEILINYMENGISIDIPMGYSGGCPLIYESDEKIPLEPRIDSGGNVYICQMFNDTKYSIGNINKDNLDSIVKSNRFNSLVWFARFGIQYMKECSSCVWQSSCGKGCIAASLSAGSIQYTDGDCFFRKQYFLNSYLNKDKELICQ